MKVLISTIGSRGEVQPTLALGLELRAIGHQAVLCVPPNFRDWVESLGFPCVPIGPDLQKFTAASPPTKRRRPHKAVGRQMVRGSLIEQFKVTSVAAEGCDLILTAGDLQHAGKSIAESLKIPHVHATYCPVTLRSGDHTPPNLGWLVRSQRLPGLLKKALWRLSDRQWNAMWREALNEQRAALGLAPVENVPRYIANEHSLVAADPVLAPAADFDGTAPFQTGAWMLRDERQLSDELETFLAAGDPPIYFGFGSMRRNDNLNQMLIQAARALGRRALVSKGWGGFGSGDDASDYMVVDDVSHQTLFPRVAAIVHHGGAGTTTTAARAGKPQVIAPHLYDQFYWSHRLQRLGIGVSAGQAKNLSLEKLTAALRKSLQPAIVERAKTVSTQIETRGARIAAERLLSMVRVIACVVLAAFFAGAAFGQAGDAALMFGNADIHSGRPNTILEMRSRFFRRRYELRNATLVDLIRTGWSVDADKVRGGPDWLDTNRFDVIAAAPMGSTPEGLKTMLRNLLAERFQLVAHRDTRGLPAYAITAGKKPQLKRADGSEVAGCNIQPSKNPPSPRGPPPEPVKFACSNMTMADFAKQLLNVREASGHLFNYPVVDRTGLMGGWNYAVKWSPRFTLRANPAASETITIFDAFETQLGLRLEFSKIATPVVVVDSVNERPTRNRPGGDGGATCSSGI
jgi:vancomycin aglycone glucosyltransferase